MDGIIGPRTQAIMDKCDPLLGILLIGIVLMWLFYPMVSGGDNHEENQNTGSSDSTTATPTDNSSTEESDESNVPPTSE